MQEYKHKHVLVTGCAGFIGSHLCDRLLHSFPEICVVGLDSRRHELRHDKYVFVQEDVRETTVFDKYKFDVIVHLASVAGVRNSLEDPCYYVDCNIKAHVHLLQLAVRQGGVKAFVYASSSSVYGTNHEVPFHESHPTDRMTSPYACSKKAMEDFSGTYERLYGLPTIGLRFFTVYGPRGRHDMAPHKFLSAIMKGDPLKVYVDSESELDDISRDFTYVDDVVQGIIDSVTVCTTVGKTEGHSVYNIGSGAAASITLRTFIATCEKVVGKRAILEYAARQKGDVPLTIADVSRARQDFGYDPRTSLESGLRLMYAWMLSRDFTTHKTLHDSVVAHQALRGNRRLVYTVQIGNMDLFLDLTAAHDTSVDVRSSEGGVDHLYICDEVTAEHIRIAHGGGSSFPTFPTFPSFPTSSSAAAGRNRPNWTVVPIPFVVEDAYTAFETSRRLKVLVHEFASCYIESLYLDTNVQIVNYAAMLRLWDSLWPATASSKNTKTSEDMAVFAHPHRRTVFEEFDEVMRLGKTADARTLTLQHERYSSDRAFRQALGQYQLTWNNVMFRRHTPELERVMCDWYGEIHRYGQRDQLSLNYACWKNARPVKVLSLRDCGGKVVASDVDLDQHYRRTHDGRFYNQNKFFTRPFGGHHFPRSSLREVVFLKQYPKLGSNLLRVNHVRDRLHALGLRTRIVDIQDDDTGKYVTPDDDRLNDIRDAVVVFVSRFDLSILRGLRQCRRDNLFIYDMIDRWCEWHTIESRVGDVVNNFDALICTSDRMRDLFKDTYAFKGRFGVHTVRHQWDARCGEATTVVARNDTAPPRFGYLGSVSCADKNFKYMHYLVRRFDVRVIDTESGRDVSKEVKEGVAEWASDHRPGFLRGTTLDFDCHVSIRSDTSPEWRFKTGTKVSTAAYFGCPIITTYEDGVVDLLPPDYPYLLRTSGKEEVVRMFEYVRATFQKEPWRKAKAMMKRVKDMTSIDNVMRNYVDVLAPMLLASCRRA